MHTGTRLFLPVPDLPTCLFFHNSLVYDRDTGHKSFLEDAFENESRIPGGSWQPAVPAWTDVVCSHRARS